MKRRTISGVLMGFSLAVFVGVAYIGGYFREEKGINSTSKANTIEEGRLVLYKNLDFTSVDGFVSSLNNLLPREGYNLIESNGTLGGMSVYSTKGGNLTIFTDHQGKIITCNFSNTPIEVQNKIRVELDSNPSNYRYKVTSTGFVLDV